MKCSVLCFYSLCFYVFVVCVSQLHVKKDFLKQERNAYGKYCRLPKLISTNPHIMFLAVKRLKE